MSLAAFQQAFAGALYADASQAPATAGAQAVEALRLQPGFAVYRNTAMKAAIDALQANHPAVLRLVGEEWFRAAAAVFVRRHPPDSPVLVTYGAAFADFLRGFAPAAEIPYLADVARLDRLWTEAHVAPDAAALAPADLARLPRSALGAVSLAPHPSARWAWFDAAPAPTIWRRNRVLADETAGEDAPIDWRPEGLLIVRPRDHVHAVPLPRAACVLLDRCAAGARLGDAALAALDAQPAADLEACIATLLRAGAFARMPA